MIAYATDHFADRYVVRMSRVFRHETDVAGNPADAQTRGEIAHLESSPLALGARRWRNESHRPLHRRDIGVILAGVRGKHGNQDEGDRKSTRLNSSHRCISYAVFCL